MPNLKVKKGNDTLTFGLTDNLRDVGEKRLPVVINGKTYYARLGADKTALVVQRTSMVIRVMFKLTQYHLIRGVGKSILQILEVQKKCLCTCQMVDIG